VAVKMKDVSPPVEVSEKQAGSKGHGFTRTVLLIGATVVFAVLALSLGLGLGLGLKHHGSGNTVGASSTSPTSGPSPSATPTNVPNAVSLALPSWRRNPQEYVLDMDWDINAAPTTRVFNLTVSEIEAAPDGK
jgi:hypothetical protein